MRRLLLAVALMVAAIAPAHAARPLPEAKLYAVYFYADWCPNCKIFSPMMGKVRSDPAIAEAPVLFVTLNLTDKQTIQQALYLATALGIGDYVRAAGSSTGYVALLDAKTKKEVAQFDRGNKPDEIIAGIKKALSDE